MKVTYLLGAGASYNALPIVNEMTARLENFRNELLIQFGKVANSVERSPNLQSRIQKLIDDIDWLVSEAKKHQTIDTLARKLFSQKRFHSDLARLKKILTVYFLFEQTYQSPLRETGRSPVFKQIPDMRYDSFLASLISLQIDDPRLNGNVKVLSWNYDLQFELAYQEFIQEEPIKQVQKSIQSIPGDWFLRRKALDMNKFSLLRLNGIAGIEDYEGNTEKTFLDFWREHRLNGLDLLDLLVSFYKFINEGNGDRAAPDIHKYLNFAWEALTDFDEKSPFSELALHAAYEIAEQTDVLVIIGYSFPIFNREIDKAIIDRMGNLKKAYVQDPSPKPIISLMKGAFARFNKIPIQEETNTSYFLVPYEL